MIRTTVAGVVAGALALALAAAGSLPAGAAAGKSAPNVGAKHEVTASAALEGWTLSDYGGPILPQANLYAIWWGPKNGWPSDTRANITNLLTNFGSSQYL